MTPADTWREFDPHAWLDKYIAEQRKLHGDTVANAIRDSAEASEMFGDDHLEMYVAQLRAYDRLEPFRSGRWRKQRAIDKWLRAPQGHDIVTDTIDGMSMQDIADIVNDSTPSQHRSMAMNNTSLYMPIVDPSIKFVRVQFGAPDSGNIKPLYMYKSDMALAVGDTVVVEARDWLQVVRVAEIDVPMPIEDTTTRYRWVVQKVHTDEFEKLLAREQRIIEHVNQMRVAGMREKLLNALGLSSDDAKLIIDGMASEGSDG